MLADLHTHSTASDGQYAPAELVRRAAERGLDVLALTDHDTVAGVAEAIEAGRAHGVTVVPGVELSARDRHSFHLLGYGFPAEGAPIAGVCADLAEGRRERAKRIAAYLAHKGVTLDLREVEETAGGVIGRPHFAQVMLRHGFVKDDREAFDRYLDTDEYHATVGPERLTARQCVEAIKTSGGKASLAHPYQLGLDDDALETLVRELTDCGLDAIECRYPLFTPRQEALYLRLAEKYGLHATGGSDFHGELVKPGIELAALELELDWLLQGGAGI